MPTKHLMSTQLSSGACLTCLYYQGRSVKAMYIFPEIEQGMMHELIPVCSFKQEMDMGVGYCAGKKAIVDGGRKISRKVSNKVRPADRIKQYTFDDIGDPLADW